MKRTLGVLAMVAALWLCVLAACPAPGAEKPAAAKPGVLEGWNAFWSRDANMGSAARDDGAAGGHAPVIRVEHRGSKDWSLNRDQRVDVAAGDIFEISARAKVTGDGGATLCVTTYDADGKARDWSFGGVTARAAADWQTLKSRFIIPAEVVRIEPRVIGDGPVTVWIDSYAFAKVGNVKTLRDPGLAPEVSASNKAIGVTLRTADATLTVADKRTGKAWAQRALRPDILVTSAKAAGGRIEFEWMLGASGLKGKGSVALDGDKPECVLAIAAEGPLRQPVSWPHPFTAEPPAYLVVPMNEGISYPVDDATISPLHLIAFGGHGICMAFWGVTDGAAGQMAILETPDDAAIRVERTGGRLVVAPEWEGQKGQFGYERRVRYVFFDAGGHVAMCKRYRAYARDTGLLKTLAEKRKEVPSVDLLVGAVNVWCWDKDGPAIARQLQAAGIERILWSNAQSPENVKALNEMPGVLSSRYDIYQDVMNPENFKNLGWNPGPDGVWPTEAWPKDITIRANGDWERGWGVDGKDGTRYPCGVVCDRQAPAYAERRIPKDLETHPYHSRFIDTTTASPWRECYSPDHPMTRTESRKFKMDLLGLVSGKFKLVCGCETGHDASVPYVHYFEGMLSLGPYRVNESGRDMQKILDEVPEQISKFQLGHAYRLPLWELVYHDCVVAQWYWGDYNNKLPKMWDKRDLFNALYGTPPMFMFNRKVWEENKDRFVRSYKATCPVARATGYSEMTDHRFLTPDRSVQQTAFANGVTVTVNFGSAAFKLSDGAELAPMSARTTGMKN